ncbi:hypothetical protein [Lonepinella sp. BR2474]
MKFSIRFYPDDSKKTTMNTVIYANSASEAKQLFLRSHPKAIIISLI